MSKYNRLKGKIWPLKIEKWSMNPRKLKKYTLFQLFLFENAQKYKQKLHFVRIFV